MRYQVYRFVRQHLLSFGNCNTEKEERCYFAVFPMGFLSEMAQGETQRGAIYHGRGTLKGAPTMQQRSEAARLIHQIQLEREAAECGLCGLVEGAARR